MNHSVHLWNSIPRSRNGLTPYELFTSIKQPSHEGLTRTRVWGCPVYVLDPKLQDGKKLPKWKKRSRLGMYVGNSPQHHNAVGLILNLQTGYVSPQYHVVYDEHFSSVLGLGVEEVFAPEEWDKLLTLDSIENNSEPTDIHDDIVPFQEFYDEFNPHDDSDDDEDEHEPAPLTDPSTEPLPLPSVPEGDDEDDDNERSDDEGGTGESEELQVVQFDNAHVITRPKLQRRS